MRKLLLTVIIALFFVSESQANSPTENAKLMGQGEFHYYFWHVYDAKLYTQEPSFSFNAPFFLSLHYKRNLHGGKIADRSAEEIRGLGFKDEITLAGWHSQMRDIFPNVKNGDILTGAYKPNMETVFYKNNQKIGNIKDPAFGTWFFGIWLHKDSSAPGLRRALLGEGK